MRQAFINDISNQLGAMNLSSEDPEENWTVFQKVVHSSAATTIGHPSRKHQDWSDGNDCHRLNCDYSLGGVMGSVLMCIFCVD